MTGSTAPIAGLFIRFYPKILAVRMILKAFRTKIEPRLFLHLMFLRDYVNGKAVAQI